MRNLKTNFKFSKQLRKWSVVLLTTSMFLSAEAISATAAETSCDPAQSTILIDCDFSGADLSGRSFVDYVIANSKFNGANLSNTNFTGVNLSGNDFSWKLDETTGNVNTNLTNANLSSSNLSGADLSGVVLTGANVTSTDFSGAVLVGVVTGSLLGTAFVLPESWHQVRGYLVGPEAVLANVDLNNLDLRGWNFSGANLKGASLNSSTFIGSNFAGADLERASLTSSNFANASFASSRLASASFNSSDLRGVDFTNADLTGLNLANAYVASTNFTRAKLISVWRPYICQDYRACAPWWYGDGYQWNDSNDPRNSFINVNLTGAKVSNFSSPGYNFNSNLPSGWTLRHRVFFGPTADLSGLSLRQLDLTNLNLSNADLTGVDLSGSNLSGTDLSNAVLTGVISGAVTGSPTLPAGWSMVNGYLVGPGAKLANASLAKANLLGLDLSGVDFTNTNLAGANLWGANLTNTNLTNANLSKAKLDQVVSSGVVGSPILPTGWSLVDGVLVGPGSQLPVLSSLVGSDLSNRDFTGFNFSGLNLSGVNFAGSNLSNATFSNANLSGANFVGAVLTATNFSRAVFTGANVSGVDFSSADISFTKSGALVGVPAALPEGWSLLRGYFFGSSANLSDANLSGVDFSKLDLANVTLSGANLAGADLRGLQLAGVSMAGLNLSGANLTGANLASANLTGANLSGADLSGVVLTGANVTNTDFSGAVLVGVVSGSLGGTPLVLPEPWHLIRGYLVGPKASLIGANLSGLDLSHWDLSAANLTGASLNSSTFIGSNFAGANLSNANLSSSNFDSARFVAATLMSVNLSDSILNYVNFTDAKLSNVNWTSASVFSTNFTRAQLIGGYRNYVCQSYEACRPYWYGDGPIWAESNNSRNSFINVNLTGAKVSNFSSPGYNFNSNLPSGWTLRHRVFFGPTADLTGLSLRQLDLTNLNLSSANLTGVDLSGSNLSGTDLSNAVLTGVISGAVTGSPTLPAGWSLVNGYLVGPGAKLANASLAKANLLGLDLSGVDFTNTNLAGANLWGANLTNTNLTNANLEGVDLTGATIEGTNFTGVSVETLTATELQGTAAALPAGWSIVDGTFGRSITLFGVSISGTPEVGQTLTVSPTTSPNGATLTYQWFRNSVELNGETTNQHVVTLADIGSSITVQVTASKGDYWSASQESAAIVVPSTFSPLTRVQLTGNNTLGSMISMSASGKSAISVLKYQVSRNGGQTWLNLNGNGHQLSFEDLGLNLVFRAVQSSEGYQTQITNMGSMSVSSAVSLPGYSAGRLDQGNSFASLGGLTAPGSRLKAIKTQWSSNVRFSGFWLSSVNGVVSTKSTYTIALTDVGATFRYVEVGVALDGSVTYRVSSPLVAKAFTFDNSHAATITGTMKLSSKLKAIVGTSWAPGTRYSYQWLANGVAMPGANTPMLTLGLDEIGKHVTFRVCGSKAGYETKCEVTAQSTEVAKGTISSTADPKITTSATKVGMVIRAHPGKWAAGSALTYQWLRDGVEIAGRTDISYLLTQQDLGHEISIRVTASKLGHYDLVKVSTPKIVN